MASSSSTEVEQVSQDLELKSLNLAGTVLTENSKKL